MEVLLWISIEWHFLEKGNAATEDHVSHDNETAGVCLLVFADQLLALITGSMGRFVERCASRHRLNRMAGPCMSSVEDLLPRAFLVSSRNRLAISIRSRQSGSIPGGGGDRTGEDFAESRCLLSEPVWNSDTFCISLLVSMPYWPRCESPNVGWSMMTHGIE